jgi:hypothetical protein
LARHRRAHLQDGRRANIDINAGWDHGNRLRLWQATLREGVRFDRDQAARPKAANIAKMGISILYAQIDGDQLYTVCFDLYL